MNEWVHQKALSTQTIARRTKIIQQEKIESQVKSRIRFRLYGTKRERIVFTFRGCGQSQSDHRAD